MLFLVLVLLGSLDAVTGWQCPNGKLIPRIFIKSGQPAIVDFQTTLQTFNEILVYTVAAFNNSNLYAATFYNNHLQNERTYLESEFIGDASRGNFTLKTNGVHTQDGGVYRLQYKRGVANWYTEMCSILFVLGKPQKATFSHDNNNVLGRNSQLSCNSLSTTYPTNHTLRLTYNWKVNDITYPSNARYKYGASNKTLTIMSVTEEDAKNNNIECSATESGDGVIGLTSNYSDEFLFTVIYGPDNCNINIQSPYALAEGNTSTEITCQSDCYPSCSYKWINSSTGKVVGSEGMFQLDKVTRYEAGNYTCICENTAIINTSKATPLQVIVNSAALFIEGHKDQKDVTVYEYDTDIQFNCEIDSYQESRIQILFKDVLLKEAHSPVLTFTRSSIMCSHAGVYTCKGSSQHAQEPSSKINIFVRCSPRPLQQIKQNKTSSLYVSATLTFTTIAYPEPGPTGFLWHKESGVLWMPLLSNNDLLVSSSGLQTNLTILNVSQSDYGRYKVKATNDIGSYEQYLLLVREDMQKETLTESCEVKSNKTGTIVGICFGVLSSGLAVYAVYLTVLYKRRSNKKGKQTTEDLNRQVTYINVAEEGTYRRINDTSGNKDDSAKLYTELAQYSKDDKSAYDVIQKN